MEGKPMSLGDAPERCTLMVLIIAITLLSAQQISCILDRSPVIPLVFVRVTVIMTMTAMLI